MVTWKKRFFQNICIYLMNITFHSIAKCTWCRFELTLPQQTLIKNYHKSSFIRCCIKLTVLLINRVFFTVVVLQCLLSRRKNDNTLSSWEQQELSSDVLHFKSNSNPLLKSSFTHIFEGQVVKIEYTCTCTKTSCVNQDIVSCWWYFKLEYTCST